MKIDLEHIYSIINSSKLESHLDIYRKAGFYVGEKTVRHPPGMRNGFVYMGPEYIEFIWVERQREYEKEKSNYHDEFRKHSGPFGFGFETNKIEKFNRTLTKRGYKVPSLYSRGPTDAKEGDKPWWTFQNFNRRTLPGVLPFALRYETRDLSKPRKSCIGKNGIFAISGVTFVAYNPIKDAGRWANVFGVKVLSRKDNNVSITLGAQSLNWMRPSVFRSIYGNQACLPHKGRFTHLRKMALLHLYAESLEKAEKYFMKAGFKTQHINKPDMIGLYVYPLKSDGYAFFISEYSVQKWLGERKSMGQNLKLIRD